MSETRHSEVQLIRGPDEESRNADKVLVKGWWERQALLSVFEGRRQEKCEREFTGTWLVGCAAVRP